MAIVDKIERNAAGNILFKDVNDNIISSTSAAGLTVYANGADFIRIQNQGIEYFVIEVALLTRLQIDPAPETAFSGTAQDLIAELSANFFFELSGGSSNVGNDLFLFQNFN